jgi:general secretion pathway protein K
MARHRALTRSRHQRGMALLVVLWACTLLAIVLGAYAVQARIEASEARLQLSHAQALSAAQAGVMLGVYELQRARVQADLPITKSAAASWVNSGRPYSFPFGQAVVTISVEDEDGKIDLNSADPNVILGLLVAAGMPLDRAQALLANIVEWRGQSGPQQLAAATQRYAAAGLNYGPRNDQFASLEELQSVLGMDQAIYSKLASSITLWSARSSPATQHAPLLALASLPGMDVIKAQRYITQRDNAAPDRPPPMLPNGMAAIGGLGTNAKTIQVRATLTDGTQADLRVTVRLETRRTDLQGQPPPWTVLRWQEGSAI